MNLQLPLLVDKSSMVEEIGKIRGLGVVCPTLDQGPILI